MRKTALISVSDKTGVIEFAKGLVDLGYQILSTGGSGKLLMEADVPVTFISEYTGQKEILDGRVKTLHPKIHAGLLAKSDDPGHLEVLEEDSILPIGVVAVNLYPFQAAFDSEKKSDPMHMNEMIDIGGPTMIRAAAKNYRWIYPVIDPQDYGEVLRQLSVDTESNEAIEFRRSLMVKVFTQIADYDLAIAKYFDAVGWESKTAGFDESKLEPGVSSVEALVLEQKESLRYGENPHQSASFYVAKDNDISWKKLQGKSLSYNNLLDFTAAAGLVRQLPQDRPAAAILKHLNPCGAAYDQSLTVALQKAKQGDPRSHFGGVIAVNRKLDEEAATEIAKDFTEILVAPGYEATALTVLSKKKNLRVIELDFSAPMLREFRSVEGGTLVQEPDPGVSDVAEAELQTERQLSDSEREDLQFAWTLCAHLKSNAICLVKDGILLASGAGQMSRIDAVEVGLMKAKQHQHDLSGAVAASDAFFPFPDCVEVFAEAGVKAVIVPGGSKGDAAVIEKSKELGISLLFAADRHFRH